MTRLDAANLIRVFDFYLAMMFVIRLARAYPVYWDAVRIVVGLWLRWPRLVGHARRHGGVFATPEVLRPVAVALGLIAIQMICSRVIWPDARLTVGELAADPAWLAVVLAAAVPMLLVDLYFVVRIGRFDRRETESYLDQAEYWLTGWRAPAVRALTLGYVNPHRMVDEGVRKGLTELGATVGWAARWTAIQVVCRVAFGLVIWLTWAANT